ncbi:MAG: hypothetical protein ACQGVK_15885 [Myxococcota bacterium]
MLTLIVLIWIAATGLAISGLAWLSPELTRQVESSDPIKRSLEKLYQDVDSTKRLMESPISGRYSSIRLGGTRCRESNPSRRASRS